MMADSHNRPGSFLRVLSFAAALLFLLLPSCSRPSGIAGESGNDSSPEQGLVAEDGKVRFRISFDKIPDEFFNCGLLPRTPEGKSVRIGSREYPVTGDPENGFYVQVEESPFNSYSASLTDGESSLWYGTSPYNDIRLPGTINGSVFSSCSSIPLFCEWKESDGAVLKFTAPYSLLILKETDARDMVSASITSESTLTGSFSYIRSQDKYEVKSARRKVTVNRTDWRGNTPEIPVLLLPGTEADLDIRLCDTSSKMSEHKTKISISPGEAFTLNLTHNPSEDLVFFEGFDRCVWGGDPIGGADGFIPFEDGVTATTGAECSGYENAFHPCKSTSAGAGYVQSSFSDSSPSVAEETFMSASYVHSRGFDKYFQLLRVQEFDGCISVGINGYSRGWVKMYPFSELPGLTDITVRFKICLQPGCTDVINFQVDGSGVITRASVDGREVEDSGAFTHIKTVSQFRMGSGNILDVPVSLDNGMKWQQVEVTVKNASEVTSIAWIPETYEVQTNGFWLDDITVGKIPGSWDRGASGSLRILYWNIQNGMWGDQGNNYENFVNWVRKYSPDICVWCEGRSNYMTGSSTSNKTPYLSNDVSASSGWAELASRYGHNYLGAAWRSGDNFPQVVTSRHPVTRELLLGNLSGGDPIWHGSGMFSIDCDGTAVNIVTVHLRPGDEYDNYRLYEISEILSSTLGSDTYSGRGNWVMVGDFNSTSHFDRAYYDLDESAYSVHQQIASYSGLTDLMHGLYPDRLISSTSSGRIDYMFLSDDLYSRVTDACTLVDSWVTPVLASTGISNFRLPSDHRPILVQIKLK